MAEEKATMKARLRAAMAEMGNPTKSKTANVGKYRYEYTTLPDVLGIVRPALQAQGLELRQSIGFAETGLTLRTAVFDDDGDITLDERPVYENKDPQGFGSYETYMRRYSLLTAFGLAADDDDGQAAVKSRQPKADGRAARKAPERAAQSTQERIEKGVKALIGISPWTRETLAPVLDALSDAEKLEWLTESYHEAKAQMAEGAR